MPLATPSFKTHWQVHVIPGEGVVFQAEQTARALRGAAYEHIVPLIDGRRSVDDIVGALAGQVDAVTVLHALARLEIGGYVTDSSADVPAPAGAFWHGIGLDPDDVLAALERRTVAVRTVGDVDLALVEGALGATGVRVGTWDDADLWLVVADDYLRVELQAINASALEGTRPCLFVRPTGIEQWLGPLVLPGETACWECLRRRLERNRAVDRLVARVNDGRMVRPAVAALPATLTVAHNLAAVAVAQILAGGHRDFAGRVVSFNCATLASERHTLNRDPHCTACGAPNRTSMRTVQLESCKGERGADGLRAVTPEITWTQYEHLVSPITGIVRTVKPIGGADGTDDHIVPKVYLADAAARTVDGLASLERSLRENSSGKGLSDMQAKVSALCEATERYSGELAGDEVKVACAWREWKQGEAIHPNDVMLFSVRQYAERSTWNPRHAQINHVPEPLADDRVVDWTPLWSLTGQRQKFLPTQLLYYRAPACDGDSTVYAVGCSNGSAAGNTLEEAVLYALLELVERDAAAVWWYNRLSRPGVDVESFEDSSLLELKRSHRDAQRDLWVLDVTHDLGIPVFVAVSRLMQSKNERLLLGLGCDPDPHVALRRACAEVNQMVVVADDGIDDWLRDATVVNQPYLAPDATQPFRRRRDFEARHSDDLLETINDCRKVVEARGMEVLVLNQTRADVGMPVVKVVVPGLRHFWARFAPGRLFDVPVAMRWLERPLREDELNPIPMFI